MNDQLDDNLRAWLAEPSRNQFLPDRQFDRIEKDGGKHQPAKDHLGVMRRQAHEIDRGVNAAVYAGPGDLLQSGYMWEENKKQLSYKPLVVVGREGRGLVVAFTADPNYRAYMDGLNILFLNAVLRGPGVAR